MEFLNFLREEPVMAWLMSLALLVTIVPMVSVLWRKMSGRNLLDEVKQPAQATKPVRFGNQTDPDPPPKK
jgi:type II secretory pathway component PulC